MAIWLNGSVKRRCPCPAPPNVSALKPDQWNSRARFSTSGLCPCAMRISVEGLTPERSATCFQFSFLSDFFRSSAFKNACVLNSDRVIQSTLSNKVWIYIDFRAQRTKTSRIGEKARPYRPRSPVRPFNVEQWTGATSSSVPISDRTSASARLPPQSARRRSRSHRMSPARRPRSRPGTARIPARRRCRNDGRNCQT